MMEQGLGLSLATDVLIAVLKNQSLIQKTYYSRKCAEQRNREQVQNGWDTKRCLRNRLTKYFTKSLVN